MKLLYHDIVLQHETGQHPENRLRFSHFEHLKPLAVVPDGATYLHLVHSEAYIDKVRQHCAQGLPLDGDTRVSHASFDAAAAATGLTIQAMQQGDFALVRPPGHHAYAAEAHGFCLFNHVAVAAQKAVNEGKKVLILDFDGHLGDGTMDVFYKTDEVLFWSLHQYPAYPGNGSANEIGSGKGMGFTINSPLPPDSGDDIFLDALDHFMPIALQFKPDIVAVSAGFDAHWSDPLLELRASANFYYQTGILLAQTFPGKLFATLEGGYNAVTLANGVNNFVAGVNGRPMPYEEAPTTSSPRTWDRYQKHLNTATQLLSKYWKL